MSSSSHLKTRVDLSNIAPGFKDPVLDTQSSFRKLLLAMSEPGTHVDLDEVSAPAGLLAATAATALVLIDYDTPLWLSPDLRTPSVESWLRFHCNCPLVEEPQEASFAIANGFSEGLDVSGFNVGDAKYPDRSTTLILQVESLSDGEDIILAGPGIEEQRSVHVSGLPENFWSWRHDNYKDFQLGVDVMLTCGGKLLSLPRTTRRLADLDT